MHISAKWISTAVLLIYYRTLANCISNDVIAMKAKYLTKLSDINRSYLFNKFILDGFGEGDGLGEGYALGNGDGMGMEMEMEMEREIRMETGWEVYGFGEVDWFGWEMG